MLRNVIIRWRFPLKGPLARAYLRACERYRSRRGQSESNPEAQGVALPPSRLRVVVAGTADLDSFLGSGEAQADYLRDLLAEVGRPLEEMNEILDFGCGCGRITRWLSDFSRPLINGCDYNGELIDWCQQNLPFVRALRTELRPPLPYADDAFDFLYAFSVFTHLSADLAGQWMSELGRVVKPGGLMWFTIHGASYRERLLPEQRERFDAGEVVVWFPEIEGTNLCGAHWPDAAVERILGSKFEVLHHFDPKADAATAERVSLPHDAYLVRRMS
ncbi:MAG: methylase involved in ubiquinone/menaquinone biosynthesis, partial [Solirubrobacterales bacterium]|nr:methylase involved in ubiquinone/menaquinone biosynthesis [Solirubrobacterales bacterium]